MANLFSVPNMITIGRILLIPVFLYVAFSELPYKDYLAAALFILLSLTDVLDGYLARKHRQITGIGKIIDPIADKLLIGSALFAFVDRIALWMIMLIIAREILITLLRIIVLPNAVVAASIWGKIKTFSQIVGVVAVMLQVPLFIFGIYAHWWLMLIAVMITIASGIDYIAKIASMIGEKFYTLPNAITTVRLFLIPLFSIVLMNGKNTTALAIAIAFIALDKADGILARKTKNVTQIGKLYDVAIDLTGIISGYVLFYLQGFLPWQWIVVFSIVTLGIIITKTIAYMQGKKRAQNLFGKTVVGLSYVFAIAVLMEYKYTYLVMVLVAALAYVYLIIEFVVMISPSQATKAKKASKTTTS